MLEISDVTESAAEFQLAVMSLRQAQLRKDISVVEIASPERLAKHSIALSAEVGLEPSSHISKHGSGRFVLLNSDSPQEGWGGNFRIIIFGKAPLESDLAKDSQITEVAWYWLTDALRNRGAAFSHEAGTVTRIISQGYGAIAGQDDHGELELRASWSPTDSNFAAHVEAWQDLLAMMSGLPPENGLAQI